MQLVLQPTLLERVEALINANVDAISIDTAHAHTKSVISILREIKRNYPNIDVVAGNIGTAEAAKMLVKEGADAVKVGIGPGINMHHTCNCRCRDTSAISNI